MNRSDAARCFVAVGFSPVTRAALAALRPTPGPGVRPEPPENLHLTLYFLGHRPLAPVIAALSGVRASAFELRIGALGRFRGRDDEILWAGVDGGPALLALHHAVGVALGEVGFRPEARPWSPHVTLARSRHPVPGFLAQTPPALHERIDAVGLYTSTAGRGGVAYERVAAVPLAGTSTVV
jgi:2'-5' RNA ligase